MTRQAYWQRKYHARYPEKYKAKYVAHNAAAKADGSLRRWYLKRKYGITPEQWMELFQKQGNKCAICERAYDSESKNWHTDHNHATGKVRGILCHICNRVVLPAVEHYQVLLSRATHYVNS